MYEGFSSFVPKPLICEFKRQITYNKIKMHEEKFTGMLVFWSLVIALAAIGLDYFFLRINPVGAFIAGFILPIFIAYVVLRLQSEAKGKFVESILPDVLQLIASNMKSGLTTERAIFVAARPEFGPMQIELLNASKRISTGEKVETALREISSGINSPVLEKTVWLISQGIKSGAQMADLLFQLSTDLKREQGLKEEISANVSIYIILILFAAAVGAPALFGVSTFISQVMTSQLEAGPNNNTPIPSSSGNFAQSLASGKRQGLDSGFVTNFAIIMLVLSSFFSAITIGVINNGKEINGIKYLIPITLVALIVFFITRQVLIESFGSLI